MMKQEYVQATEDLLSFISRCPTPYQVVDEMEKMLLCAGYEELPEGKEWKPSPGKGYYVTRNRSSVLAFRAPTDRPRGFMIAATHTDSPTFRLKIDPESVSAGCLRLSTERYGGMILSSWLDRPLSIAGRAVVKNGDRFCSRHVMLARDLCLIPNVAIHFNRKINDGYAYQPAVDLLPLLGAEEARGGLRALLAKELGVSADEIVSTELSLYDRTPGVIFGLEQEFFASPRIDNLECTYACLRGFLDAETRDGVAPVLCAFDNEETGSMTKQGAGSGFLSDAIARLCRAYDTRPEELLPSTMVVSADNAHAIHPNHPELSDSKDAPRMNGGVVIKHNAAQRYATDAVSEALFAHVAGEAGVPVQHYSNRSDMQGGSTLGAVLSGHLAPMTVDIGLAQLAMHSAYETAGAADVLHLIRAMRRFFSTWMHCERDGDYRLSF